MKIPQKPYLLIIISLTLLNIANAQQWYQHGNPHFINEQDYQRLVINPQTRNKGVTMLKFFTPWCRYCKYLKDIIDHLKSQDTWSITIYEVNCDGDNHHFCGKMGVHSFPKMKVFENGNVMDNMDGFYPYEVVRELFLKYNRTEKVPQPSQAPVIDLTKEGQEKREEHQGDLNNKEDNFVEPQVVTPKVENHENQHHQQAKHQQPKHEQPKPQEKPVDVPLHHVQQVNPQTAKPQQTQHHQIQQPKATKPQSPQNSNPTDHAKPQQQTPHQQSAAHQQQPQTPPQVQQPNTNNIKKTQQMIEQQQNIAVVDQDLKQAQKQKKIIQDLSTKTTDTIDLTKILPGQEHVQYGKYIIYAICIFVGGYYFVHIMKAEPTSNESVKSHTSSSRQSSQKGSRTQIPSRVSIQDSELREELHFEHPNQEEVNFNNVEVRDEDL